MGNQVPFSTIYFCAHCEDEVVGLPYGERLASGRPLCQRCARIGEDEGWGRSNEPKPDVHVYEGGSKRGIILILALMVVVGVALVAAHVLYGHGSRK